MCRVFWRHDVPWVLVRLQDGVMRSLPWAWTDLPVTEAAHEALADANTAVLLAPIALRDLVRGVRALRERSQAGASRERR